MNLTENMLRSGQAALIRRFAHDVSGATAIEYALVASGIGGAVAATLWNLGSEVKAQLYDKIAAIFGP
jgi:pilus assembly protein Flp/PilA